MRKNFMVIRHSIKELLAKSMVTRQFCIVGKIDEAFQENNINFVFMYLIYQPDNKGI